MSRWTDERTDGQTDRGTFQLIESIGPEGQCFENHPPLDQKKTCWTPSKWYWCYYPHRSRDLVSPVCGIFFILIYLPRSVCSYIYSFVYPPWTLILCSVQRSLYCVHCINPSTKHNITSTIQYSAVQYIEYKLLPSTPSCSSHFQPICSQIEGNKIPPLIGPQTWRLSCHWTSEHCIVYSL